VLLVQEKGFSGAGNGTSGVGLGAGKSLQLADNQCRVQGMQEFQDYSL